METGISDIQKVGKNKVEITFCTYPEAEDFMVLTLDIKTMAEIKDYFCDHLSYGAQLRKEKKKLGLTKRPK